MEWFLAKDILPSKDGYPYETEVVVSRKDETGGRYEFIGGYSYRNRTWSIHMDKFTAYTDIEDNDYWTWKNFTSKPLN